MRYFLLLMLVLAACDEMRPRYTCFPIEIDKEQARECYMKDNVTCYLLNGQISCVRDK